MFSVDLYVCNVVLKDSGDVDLVKDGIVRLGEQGRKVGADLREGSF